MRRPYEHPALCRPARPRARIFGFEFYLPSHAACVDTDAGVAPKARPDDEMRVYPGCRGAPAPSSERDTVERRAAHPGYSCFHFFLEALGCIISAARRRGAAEPGILVAEGHRRPRQRAGAARGS